MRGRTLRALGATSIGGLMVAGALSGSGVAHADAVAYLVNVTVRPGYNFANADHALGYGYRLCDRARDGVAYPQMIKDIKTDFRTTDEFQASYLISQAVNELCPQHIWTVRQSAGGYRPAPAP